MRMLGRAAVKNLLQDWRRRATLRRELPLLRRITTTQMTKERFKVLELIKETSTTSNRKMNEKKTRATTKLMAVTRNHS